MTTSSRYEGKLAIFLIFGVALIAAVGSLWYHHRQSRRVLAFWTPEKAVLIARTPEVEALRLTDIADDAPADERVEIGGRTLAVAEVKRVTFAPGTVNIRHALLQDMAYLWPEESPKCDAPWEFALRFVDEKGTATVLFALDSGCIALEGSQQITTLVPGAVDEFRAFFDEQFGSRKAK